MNGQFISACCHEMMLSTLLSYTSVTLGLMTNRAGIRGLSAVERKIIPKAQMALHRGQAALTPITGCDSDSIPQREVGQGFYTHFTVEETETQQGGHFLDFLSLSSWQHFHSLLSCLILNSIPCSNCPTG